METLARDFILQAIKEGIEEAPLVYAERLEQRLAFDIQLQEAEGNVADILEEQITDDVLLYCDINEHTGEIVFNKDIYLSESSMGRLMSGTASPSDRLAYVDMVKGLPPDAAPKPSYADIPLTRRAKMWGKQTFSKDNLNAQFDKSVDAAKTAASSAATHVVDNRGAYALGTAGAALAGAGIYAAYKYLNSPKKIQGAIQKSQARLATAKKENDQKTAIKMEKKLKVLNAKMDALRKKGQI